MCVCVSVQALSNFKGCTCARNINGNNYLSKQFMGTNGRIDKNAIVEYILSTREICRGESKDEIKEFATNGFLRSVIEFQWNESNSNYQYDINT